MRANHESAFVFVINHEAEDSKTSVRIADPEFVVEEIFNVTEGRNVTFRILNHTIVFEAEAPRQKPQTTAPVGKQETAAKYLNNCTCK